MTAFPIEHAPACSCNYSGEGLHIHQPDCVRWVWLVEHYRPPELEVVDGRVAPRPKRKIA